MGEIAAYVAHALGELASGSTWIWIIIGTFMGIIVGAIPGFTSSMATGILLPVTFALTPVNALVFLISVYIATIYGGSITAILLNTPGAPESSASTFDGYQT
jgi:putative tricarboxylic transport membrane protein